MFDVKHLGNLIEIIEEPKNIKGGSLYRALLKTCTVAEVMVLALYDSGELGDNEKLNLSERIEKAKEDIIETYKKEIRKILSVMTFRDTEMVIDAVFQLVVF